MELVTSLEARWYLSTGDARVARLEHWFDGAEQEGVRVDHYLRGTSDVLGIKIRNAAGKPIKHETKFLIGTLGPTSLTPKVTGVLERWRKASLELGEGTIACDASWLEVAKERRVRKFAFTGGRPLAVKLDDRPTSGCSVELARLPGFDAYTFGFEAFGPGPTLLPAFTTVTEEVFQTLDDVELGHDISLGYPAWVASRH